MRLARRLLGVALFVAILVLGWRFAADHALPVSIVLPGLGGTEVPLWLALLVAFGVGAALAGSVALLRLAHMGLLARRHRKIIRGLESEIHQLRNLPLSTDEPALTAAPAEPIDSPAAERALGRGA